jgi:hypothetical protein
MHSGKLRYGCKEDDVQFTIEIDGSSGLEPNLSNLALTSERIMNYVPLLFSYREGDMFRALIEEAAALASLALFLGMIAIWAQIVATLGHVPEAWG